MSLELRHLSDLSEEGYNQYKQYAQHGAFIHCHPFFSIFGESSLPPEHPNATNVLQQKLYQWLVNLAEERVKRVIVDTTPTDELEAAYLQHRFGKNKVDGEAIKAARAEYTAQYQRAAQERSAEKQQGITRQNVLIKYLKIFQLLNEYNYLTALRENNQLTVLVFPGSYRERQSGGNSCWTHPDEFCEWMEHTTGNQPNFIITESTAFNRGTLDEATLQSLVGLGRGCGANSLFISGSYLGEPSNSHCLNDMIASVRSDQTAGRFGRVCLLPEVMILFNGQYSDTKNLMPTWVFDRWTTNIIGWHELDGDDILPMVGDLLQSARDGHEKLSEAVYAQHSLNQRIVRWIAKVCIPDSLAMPWAIGHELSELDTAVGHAYSKLTRPQRGPIIVNDSTLERLAAEADPSIEISYMIDLEGVIKRVNDGISRTQEGLFLKGNIRMIGIRDYTTRAKGGRKLARESVSEKLAFGSKIVDDKFEGYIWEYCCRIEDSHDFNVGGDRWDLTEQDDKYLEILRACFNPIAAALGLKLDELGPVQELNVRKMVERVATLDKSIRNEDYDVFSKSDGSKIFLERRERIINN